VFVSTVCGGKSTKKRGIAPEDLKVQAREDEITVFWRKFSGVLRVGHNCNAFSTRNYATSITTYLEANEDDTE
jgi:hypothetical protein